MKKRRLHELIRKSVLGILSFLLLISGIPVTSYAVDSNTAVIYPQEYEGAIKNPLMGLAEKDFFVNTAYDEYCLYDQTLDYNSWSTLMMTYIPWDVLEDDVDDTIEKIAEYCDRRWRGKGPDGQWHSYEEYNIKVIPRVYLRFPSNFGTFYGLGGDHWPSDLKAGDFTSSDFNNRLKRLVERLGQLWDNDPRVAYIQMGIFGTWGEQHGTAMPSNIGTYFSDNFKNKQVQVRYYDGDKHDGLWNDFQFGQYNDSIGDMQTDPNKWPSCVIGGEPAYDYGTGVANIHGTCPHVTAMDREYTYNTANMIRKTHSMYLTWLGDNAYGTRWADAGDPHGEGVDYYYQNKNVIDEGSEIFQKQLGYRYVISEFSYTKSVTPGGTLDVSFKVQNKGAAPMYYNWPVQISLKDSETGAIVWNDTFQSVDITEWKPGSGYTNFDKKSGAWSKGVLDYTTAAETYTETESFTLPSDLSAGRDYIVQLAVLDPEGGNVPSLRFAINNYTSGGYHPMGYVGVGKEPTQTELSPSEFDDLKVDTSLRYYRSGTQAAAPSTLAEVRVLDEIPVVLSGTDGFDLANVNVSGINTDGTVHNLTAAKKEWNIESGSEYATIENGVLKPVSAGQGTIAVTVNGVKSAAVAFAVTGDTASVSGTVRDFSGAVISGVQVELFQQGKLVKSTVSDEAGQYSLSPVLAGDGYTLTASKDKYRSASVDSISLIAGQTLAQNLELQIMAAGRYDDDFSNGSGNWNVNKYGTWEVQDKNYVHIADGSSYSNRWRNVSGLKDRIWEDATYEVDIKCGDSSIGANQWGAFMFRRSSVDKDSGAGNSGYLVLLRKNGEIAINVGGDGKNKDSLKELAKAASEITDTSEYHRLKIVTKKENIKVYIDNGTDPVLEVNDSTYSYGYVALGANDKGWTFDNLSITPAEEPMSTDDLNKLIAAVSAKITYGVYTDESLVPVQQALEAAKAAVNTENISEENLRATYAALQEAEGNLVSAYLVSIEKNEGGSVLDGEAEVTSVKMLKREYKTLTIRPDEGFHIDQLTVNGNNAEITDPKGFNYIVKLIIENINIEVIFAADTEETTSADKTELAALYAEMEQVQQGDYSEECWQAFQEQMEKAETVLNQGTASQQEVDNALKNLKEAFGNLRGANDSKTKLEMTGDPSVPNTAITGTFSPDARLVVQSAEDTVYAEMSAQMTEGFESVGVYEVHIVGGTAQGPFTLTFEVGVQYNGRKAIVYHKKADAAIERFDTTVADGKVTVTTESLSPFMVALEKIGSEPGTPSEPGETPTPGEPSNPGGTPTPGEPPNSGETPSPGESSNPGGTPTPVEPPNPGETPALVEPTNLEGTSNPNEMVKISTNGNTGANMVNSSANSERKEIEESVKTGDESGFINLFLISIIAFAVIVVAIYRKKCNL